MKLTDHYLSVTEIMRESLQLLGSTAMLIAAKFEVRLVCSNLKGAINVLIYGSDSKKTPSIESIFNVSNTY